MNIIRSFQKKIKNTLSTDLKTFFSRTLFNEKGNLTVLLTVILIVLILGIVLFLFNFTKDKIFINKNSSDPIATPSYVEYKYKNLVLKRKTANGSEVVFSVPESGDKKILRWKDLLFYGTESYSDKVKLFSHNLNTGDTKTIFEEESSKRRYVSDLQVIEDTLFFSVGGYLAGGGTYWINLPPTGKPQKISDGSNGRVEYMKNRFWLIQGEGDGCGGMTTYSLLNINTKRVTPIATSKVGCAEGEEYIDIDKRDRMLLSFHTQDFGGTQEQDFTGIYKNIVALPLTNPTAKIEVISKQMMPVGIYEIKYSEEQDKLLLFGSVVYLYDFNAGKLEKILDVPKDWINAAIQSWEDNVVCLTQYENEKKIGVDLSIKQIIDNSNCPINPSPSPKPYKEIEDAKNQEFIKKLDLPLNYEFVLEEVN